MISSINNANQIIDKNKTNQQYYKKLKKEQLNYLLENNKLHDIFNISKFKIVKYFDEQIRTNFIQYNGDTLLLLIRLVKNIYCCYKQTGIPSTFLLTAKQLTDKNEKLKIYKSVNSTFSRLKILEEEGVIKSFQLKNKGTFYVLTADITEPFDRQTLKSYKQINIANTKELIEMTKDYKDFETATGEELCDTIEEVKQEENLIENLKEKVKELEEETKDIEDIEKVNEEIEEQTEIEKKLDEIDIGDNSRAVFKSNFYEFIGARETATGRKLKAKEQAGITRTLNQLIEARSKGVDPFKLLEEGLVERWQGLFATQYSKLPKDKTNIKKYNNYYDWRYSKEGSDALKMSDYFKTLEKIEKGEYKSQEQAIQNTTAYQAQKLNTMATTLAKKEGAEVIIDKFRKEEATKLETSKRIYLACKMFDKNKPVDKNLFLNILDKEIGEKTYLSLMEYYESFISNKYPQDKERREDFIQVYNVILKIAREKTDYIPLLFVAHIMNNKLPQNWVDNVNFDLLDDFYNKNLLIDFITYNVLKKEYRKENGEVYNGYITTEIIKENSLKYYNVGIDFEKEQLPIQKLFYYKFFGFVLDKKDILFNNIPFYDIYKFFFNIGNIELVKNENNFIVYYETNTIQNGLLIQQLENYIENLVKKKVKLLKRK